MTFNQWALAHEPAVRLAAFFGVFALMALWEAVAPRRARLLPRHARIGYENTEPIGYEVFRSRIALARGR